MWKWVVILSFALTATLSAEVKVLAFTGSIRENSFNKRLIAEATCLAREMGANVTLIDLKDYPMPFFNQDLEAKEGMPLMAKQFRKLMIESDVILIASPEYNASVSAVLKNAIDWASRGENGGASREAFKGKKFAIMATSPGSGGGSRGLKHLRTILDDIGGTVIPLQFVAPYAYSAFDETGSLNGKNKMELKNLIQTVLK